MLIGIDFDNTIVCYDALFHRVALERTLIPQGLAPSKLEVRDHLRKTGREDLWTEMQGYVYGARMGEATTYPGVLEFFSWARAAGIELAIVSHKTRVPFAGPAYDLHQAAHAWIVKTFIDRPVPLLSEDKIFFELTKGEKVARIAAIAADCFIDDLSEIFVIPEFPRSTAKLLFDPEGKCSSTDDISAFRSWKELREHIAATCKMPI